MDTLGFVEENGRIRKTAVTDIPLLRQLHREAATAVSLTAFVERLTELTKDD